MRVLLILYRFAKRIFQILSRKGPKYPKTQNMLKHSFVYEWPLNAPALRRCQHCRRTCNLNSYYVNGPWWVLVPLTARLLTFQFSASPAHLKYGFWFCYLLLYFCTFRVVPGTKLKLTKRAKWRTFNMGELDPLFMCNLKPKGSKERKIAKKFTF